VKAPISRVHAAALAAVLLLPAPGFAAEEGQDFTREVKLLFRIVACAGSDPIPPGLETVVEAHCKALRPLMEAYREKYIRGPQDFLQSLQPKDLPTSVVYPFGGGDLLSALTTYKDLREVTTLSLEHSGDPRRIVGIDAARLEDSLLRVRKGISGLLWLSDSTSENMIQLQRGEIPGQLAFFLIGLAVHGHEPTALRYFRVEPDGSLHYLNEAGIAALEPHKAKQLNTVWKSPDFSLAFSNSELHFRPRGSNEAPRVHRHIAANLMDGPLAKDPRVLKHLEQKGRVAAMTKAASYTLWSKSFSRVRRYLVAHLEFMISDSTGIPPQYAAAAGLIQETYGNFDGPFLEANMKDGEDFCALWAGQPKRELKFRYGYVDVLRQNHLLVTKRPAAATP
jgi:hypothetical protein